MDLTTTKGKEKKKKKKAKIQIFIFPSSKDILSAVNNDLIQNVNSKYKQT